MTPNLGFGKPQLAPKRSPKSSQRAEAAKTLDKMRQAGVPEFEVYIRIKDKKSWYPVGAIAVKRSDQINRAIFANQADLLQGALRLFPLLRKHQNNLEYGYRLKEYKDEPIQLAVEPAAVNGTGIQAAFSRTKERISALLKR